MTMDRVVRLRHLILLLLLLAAGGARADSDNYVDIARAAGGE